MQKRQPANQGRSGSAATDYDNLTKRTVELMDCMGHISPPKNELFKCLSAGRQIIGGKLIPAHQLRPQADKASGMGGEFSNSAWMCEMAVEESLFPLKHRRDVSVLGPTHVSLAYITRIGGGVPIRRNRQLGLRLGTSRRRERP